VGSNPTPSAKCRDKTFPSSSLIVEVRCRALASPHSVPIFLAMPELAEVEFYRRRWDAGMGRRVVAVELNAAKRIFRGNDLAALQAILPRRTLQWSEARGKQMLFRFGRDAWLGLHLGMTGALCCQPVDFRPGKHDHLVLRQRGRSLVFSDPRLFGRILFHLGARQPAWWAGLPPSLMSPEFTLDRTRAFLRRRARSPIKAVLLQQEFFIGIGNWMADEILWRSRIHPRRQAGTLSERESAVLWRTVRFVCRGALRIVAKDYSDPPPSWLFRHRWKKGGLCPREGTALDRGTIGGRTTAWCPVCQPEITLTIRPEARNV
jgi:formamidopyrimidine-DNA glycosylase